MLRTASPNVTDWRGAPGVRVTPACAQRDSGSHFHANATLTSTSALAKTPGAAAPNRCRNDPNAGPMTTPALVAADSQPSAFARSRGSIVSTTYACTTPVVPPPSPCTNRDRNNSQTVCAKPNTAYAIADVPSPTSNAGRRP